MVTQNRYLNAAALLDRLFEEGQGLQTIASVLDAEISNAERLKISLIEEEIRSNPEAVVLLTNDIDSYIMKLQEVLVEIGTDAYTRNVLDSQDVTRFREKILKILATEM